MKVTSYEDLTPQVMKSILNKVFLAVYGSTDLGLGLEVGLGFRLGFRVRFRLNDN
jgi:hypothetical protein